MLRLTEIKLPLEHTEADLAAAIADKLEISAEQLQGFSVFKRSYDARQQDNILLIYHLDVQLAAELETQLLEKFVMSVVLPDQPRHQLSIRRPGRRRLSQQ